MYIWRRICNTNKIELDIKDSASAYMKYVCSLSAYAYREYKC